MAISPLAFSRRKTRVYDKDSNISHVIADVGNELASVYVSLPPAGSIIATLASIEPVGGGWLLLNGQILNKADYPELYAVVGDAFGSTVDTFALPDWRGRILIGASGSTAMLVGEEAGSATVTLATTNLPVHTHAVTDAGHTHTFTGTAHGHAITDPDHTHTITDAGHTHASGVEGGSTAAPGAGTSAGATGTTGSSATGITVDAAATGITVNNTTAGGTNSTAATGITIGAAGSGTAFSILPPVAAVNWLVHI